MMPKSQLERINQERENKMTGNEIIKDLVFSYGFNDKIN